MRLDSGIRAGAGSDSAQISTLDPWLTLYYMVTGKNGQGMLHRLSPEGDPEVELSKDSGCVQLAEFAGLVALCPVKFLILFATQGTNWQS